MQTVLHNKLQKPHDISYMKLTALQCFVRQELHSTSRVIMTLEI